MLRILTGMAIALLGAVVASPANSQVAVGPGFVDAPFVHVDWFHGHVHVQAACVDVCVNLPHRCWVAPPCGSINGPAIESIAPPTPEGELAGSAAKLNRELATFETGDTWQRYLRVGSGGALSEEGLGRSGAQAVDSELQTALAHFDSAATTREYRTISMLPAFRQTHKLLAGYVASLSNRSSSSPEPVSMPVSVADVNVMPTISELPSPSEALPTEVTRLAPRPIGQAYDIARTATYDVTTTATAH
jgi:hypothetical protein